MPQVESRFLTSGGIRLDLEIVEDELDRLTRVTERLIRVIRLQGESDRELVELDLLLTQTVERWAQVADRHWASAPTPGPGSASSEAW